MPVVTKQNRPSLFGRDCVLYTPLSDIAGIQQEGWVINGAPTIQEGSFGKAMQFDGANDFIEMDNMIPLVNNLAVGSIAFLVNMTIGRVLDIGLNTGTDFLYMWGEATVLRTRFEVGNVVSYTFDSSAIINDGWHHVVLTQNGVVAILYIDGVDVGDSSAGATPGDWFSQWNAIYFDVGQRNDGTSRLNGLLTDLAFYSRALSQADVTYLYESTIGAA